MTSLKITRREFIAGSAALAVLPSPSFASAMPPRAPFLRVGQICDFLYFEDWSRPSQPETISSFVEHIGEWDGNAYPIVLATRHYGVEYWDGIDSEWCLFREEVPDFSWGNFDRSRYPNIHAYVREKRFGEDPRLMRERMDRNSLSGREVILNRPKIPTRKTLFDAGVRA